MLRIGPPETGGGSIRGQRRGIAQKAEPHCVTLLLKVPRGYKAVAAIVAGAAQDRDGARVGKAARHLVGHGASRVLHERLARHPTLDGETIGARHLFCGQKLDHDFPLIAGRRLVCRAKAAAEKQIMALALQICLILMQPA